MGKQESTLFAKDFKMKILVACEESQEVCKAFRNKGHEAYSCDILDCSGGHPEWHIKGDVLKVLDGGRQMLSNGSKVKIKKWDMIIAFPPCTYLSNAGSINLHKNGKNNIVSKSYFNPKRLALGKEAKEFFMKIYNADCRRVAIENPTPAKIHGLPSYTQAIQPFEFGHKYRKRTCLWLRGLPPLKPITKVDDPIPWCRRGYGKKYSQENNCKSRGVHLKAFIKSKTFKGIAQAMAEQWGGEFLGCGVGLFKRKKIK